MSTDQQRQSTGRLFFLTSRKYRYNVHATHFLDPEGGSQKATLLVVVLLFVVINSLKKVYSNRKRPCITVSSKCHLRVTLTETSKLSSPPPFNATHRYDPESDKVTGWKISELTPSWLTTILCVLSPYTCVPL